MEKIINAKCIIKNVPEILVTKHLMELISIGNSLEILKRHGKDQFKLIQAIE